MVAVTFSSPQSFLQLPGATASWPGALSAGLQFRTWNRAGLLLTFEIPHRGGVVWLYLSEARLHLQVHKAGRTLVELSTGQLVSDGLAPPTSADGSHLLLMGRSRNALWVRLLRGLEHTDVANF